MDESELIWHSQLINRLSILQQNDPVLTTIEVVVAGGEQCEPSAFHLKTDLIAAYHHRGGFTSGDETTSVLAKWVPLWQLLQRVQGRLFHDCDA